VSAPSSQRVAAIVAARGGSKGIPRKNLADFCGKPLLVWTLEQALAAKGVGGVWVTSDDDEILSLAAAHGAHPIRRPDALATDNATSEAAWIHALDEIEADGSEVDVVCALQATSPLREPADLERALAAFAAEGCDSLFSAARLDDFLVWERGDGALRPVNYDPANRGRRQDRPEQYVENGSFYLVRPEILRTLGNRIGGRVGISVMAFWKSFEIDDDEGLEMCAALMRRFLIR
jgi:N-acylneuraminate cytidylyltransferase